MYTYDNNGNTLSAMKDGTLVYSYTYGLFGTQDSYTSDAVVYTYYTYRPDGLRHSIGNTVHLWDGANIVADVEGNSVIVYFRGINLIYADEDGEQTYYHFNAHGDVVVLTNASGTKTKTYSYNAFGVEYNPGTYDTNPFRYCGEYYDTVSGTIYLRARYYNSDLGRFTQEDPIRDGSNWYAYCDSNPVMFVDPSGCNSAVAQSYLQTWTVGTCWLPAIDTILPIGDIIYVAGAVVTAGIDLVNYIGVDNIVRFATDGVNAVKNGFDKLVDQIEKTTNPPEPEDEWDIHNLKPGEKWINGQPYHDVVNKAHHIFENKLHNHQLNSFLESFGNDELEAYQAMTKAAQDYTNAMGLSNEKLNGVTQAFKINGFDVMIRFSNINGYVRVTSAYIPT